MPRLSSEQQQRRRLSHLDAAERCFIRDGFHRTSMQAIAKEAQSSAGGLYLYFVSKEDLIAGLIDRDRHAMAQDFAAVARALDPLLALRALGQRLFVEDPRERWQMTVQIWSEAVRDSTVRDLCRTIQEDCRRYMRQLLELIVARNGAAGVDVDALVDLLMLVSDGIFKQRAIDEAFDAARAFRALMATLDAGLRGDIAFRPSEETTI